ncbi:hypothetical protein PR048_032685 [Dryococelus australis]|uniref:Uncharacterized protein n=1 Tax=Dryococelus australis TaxID=614101 RepID=A0ABQ9G2W8_9NEOP|nr:hypothetical protein PR048_032685 [Dryococelus australis]
MFQAATRSLSDSVGVPEANVGTSIKENVLSSFLDSGRDCFGMDSIGISGLGLGFRAAIPKMPSFKCNPTKQAHWLLGGTLAPVPATTLSAHLTPEGIDFVME